ncbi:hypothetical protein BON30_07210 [Cystobacter ferrugineus]|uniref:Uncharacterized protein n=1 Tax=Cystobacter ferrugineus TaxID=83449 RepID=A0A1L9BEN8_9BACT|nr:hypothetical protein BON30_07210 [Cystobacter ferrugineus]
MKTLWRVLADDDLLTEVLEGRPLLVNSLLRALRPMKRPEAALFPWPQRHGVWARTHAQEDWILRHSGHLGLACLLH